MMVKDLERGGSWRSPPRSQGDPSSSPMKGNKVVTFSEREIVPFEARDPTPKATSPSREEPPKKDPSKGPPKDPSREPSPKDPSKGKEKKVAVNYASELDAGLEKIRTKFPEKSEPSTSTAKLVRQYSGQPWELDPANLVIGKIIGHGSYGYVYYGKYNGQEVAIKMLEWGDSIDSDDSRDISLQYKFFMEVETMFKLGDHPNICKFLGASMGSTSFSIPSPLGRTQVPVANMMCCIVMEYVARGNLRQFWIGHRKTGKRRMPFRVILQFAIDIAKGLQFLHSKRMLHRDLKPDNILMSEDCILKIADFGLSRPWPDRGDTMSIYRGTPNYTAPEIISGSNNYNHKCDVYSYAICIWELYTCDLPFPDKYLMDQGKTNLKIANNNLRPKIPICCPAELRRIIVRCWDNNPANRPEMTEVLDWLSRIDTDRPRCNTNACVVETCACMAETCCRG